MNIVPAIPGNVTALTEHAHTHLFWDFETRSTLDLTEVGAWRYATHSTTDIWCCGFCVDDGPTKIWVPGDPTPPEFIEAAQNPNRLVHAFNDQFERLIAQHIMAPRYGWPIIPVERHRCSQAAALALALPARLEGVAHALRLTNQKDAEGYKLMMLMSKPRPPRKDEDPSKIYWFDDPERVARLGKYCKQDVAVERELDHRIGSLSVEEQPLWGLDAGVNDRGVYIDGGLLDGAIRIAEAAQTEISAELFRITEGAIETVNQLKIKKWLGTHGCEVANLQKTTLQKALTRSDLPPATRRVIELRLNGAHAAAAKLRTIRDWRNPDGRVRGMFRYHGASTGRWTSVGLQAHNMKRPLVEDLAAAIEDVTTGDLDRMRRYPQPMSVVGDITRALFRAAPGHRLITADFSGIESRVTAWLSGEQSKIDQWAKFDRTGAPEDEPYFILGKKFGLSGEQVRPTGKTADLAFGYMGAVGAWRKLAPPDDTSTDDEIRRRQQAWRAAHPNTVRFWRALDSAAIKAVREPGTTVQCRCVAFRCEGDFLFMRLPSGREIAYPYPRLRINDRDHYVVVFMDNEKGKWVEHRQGRGAYGGIWTENAVQAVARDVFAAAMPRLEAAGYPIVLHVHDEICAEVPEGFGSAKEFLQILTTPPSWADGLPIAAKVREGERFCKITPPAAASEKQATNAAAEEHRSEENAAAEEDQQRLSVTLSPNQQAQAKCTEEMTLTELGDPILKTSATSKDELPWLKLANTNADDEADIDTHTVWVTFFLDTRAQLWGGGEVTLPQLAKKIAARTAASKAELPLLKLAKFGNRRSNKNCLRTDENVESVSGIEVEHDAGEIPFEVAVETVRKAKLRALAYTSPSWEAGVKEKWRILLPLAQEHAPASRAELVARVNGLFGGKLTDECFVLSQTFYFGHLDGRAHRVEVIDGDFLDHRDDLKTGAVGKSTGERKRGNVLAFSERDRTTPARSYDEIMELLEKSQTINQDGSGNWHNAMLAATASMIGLRWSDDEIYDATEPYCERGWGDSDIAELIESGRNKWQMPDPGWLAKGELGQIIKQATESTPDAGGGAGGGTPGTGGGGGTPGTGGGAGGGTPGTGGGGTPRPVIKYGALSEMADQAAKVLLDAAVPFYQRGNRLVRPVLQPVQSFGGKSTMAAQLVEVELPYLRDTLCRHSHWIKWNATSKKWLPAHPHVEAARVLLNKFGDWTFPTLAGIITTPTLRPDGSILKDAGYDPATHLLLIDPPPMPEISEKPTRDDALAALKLLKGLLSEFPFEKDHDDNGSKLLTSVSRSVALSATISTVCRGAYPVVPVHIVDAPAAGTGKSYFLSTVSWIATGQAMPTLGSSKQEELDKRLDTAVLSGRSLICIDNVVGEIGGETICRLTEQERPLVRIFGVLKDTEIDARSISFFANGNNIIVVGDFCRRVVRCCLDAEIEHPETRQFTRNPKQEILADRGKYIAACLTICRAYAVAGRPNRVPQLASYGEWSDTVRSALVWLGEADPVMSQDKSHADDPEVMELLTVLNEWKAVIGTGAAKAATVRDVIVYCEENSLNQYDVKEYTHKGLRDAVLAVMPVKHSLKPHAQALGLWLRSKKNRRIGKMRFRNKAETSHSSALWWVEEEG